MSRPFISELKNILHTPFKKGDNVWIAPTAMVFGQVTLGHHASVWFGAVLRGDGDAITIGDRSNVQDNAVIHVDPGFPVTIGHDVIIGHRAIVHGAAIGNYVLVGMGATILNGARVGDFCIIGAHALVTEGMVIPDRSMVLGTPAKVARQITPEQEEKIRQNAENYVELGAAYLEYWR